MAHFTRAEIISHYDTSAAIPSQDRLVITRGPHRLGRFKAIHRLAEKLVCSHSVLCKHRLSTPFVHNAGVVSPFVIAADTGQVFRDASIADGIVLAKTVAHSEDNVYQSVLIVG